MRRFLVWLIENGWLKVYSQGHLYHAAGSLYMGRWAVFETRWLSCRLHHIATADLDRHLHDHPWNFVSVVLCGGYAEMRPQKLDPCFREVYVASADTWEEDRMEWAYTGVRVAGSIGFRHATDRHRVVAVMPNTYTLFIYGPKRQWWGFYTPKGKVFWKDYPSCHAALQPGGDAIEERT